MGTTDLFLAATDFSSDARHAAGRAAMLAHAAGVEMGLLHVVSNRVLDAAKRLLGIPPDIDERLVSQARAELDALITEIAAAGVRPAGRVAVGDTVDEIASAANSARLLVLGAHGASGLGDLFLGSTAERVLRRTQRPVLIVKQEPRDAYRRLMVPVAFGPYSLSALQSVLGLAPDADVSVLHVFGVPYEARLQLAGLGEQEIDKYREAARAEALSRMEQLIGAVGTAASRFRRRVEYGDAARTILAQARETGTDLIVMGRQGDSAVREMLLGSVTRHILSSGECDMLIVGAESMELPTNED